MCGINGIWKKNSAHAELNDIITDMNQGLKHRGPDDDGAYVFNNIALGHRRLSIIDLSEAGHQPMLSDDGRYVLTFNGELYNYRELKTKLDDYEYKSDTDSEVLLAAFKKWGSECLEKLNGMFAFAIWDKHREELFLARDRLGIKPLYYYNNGSDFIFSSEIRALLNSKKIPRKINRDGLLDYFRYQTVHAPETIVRDVYMLMPGNYMVVSDSKFEVKSYWDLNESISKVKEFDLSYASVTSSVKSLLTKSVKRRLVADVPFGAFLSGGIDSSIIVSLMSKLIPGKVNTFSVTFDEQQFSEAAYSQLIARQFDTHHTEIKLKADDFLNYLPDALNAMDHPSGDGPNTYVISKVTRDAGITMALSGLGGDELFAGYPVFKRNARLQKIKWIQNFPVGIRSRIGKVFSTLKPSVYSDKLEALLSLENWDFENTYLLSRQLLLDKEIKSLLNDGTKIDKNRVKNLIKNKISNKNTVPGLSKTSIAEISTYMQNILLRDTDQMSMANALEVRVPFLDHNLVEYVLAVPDKFKYPHSPKKLLIDSLEGYIPDKIIHRQKMGFELPWRLWLKNELQARVEQDINNLSERPFINTKQLQLRWKNFLDGDSSIRWSQIWVLTVLEEWLEQNEMDF